MPLQPEAPAQFRPRVWPSVFCVVAGALGLWFSEAYKPSASNQLGLNGNSFYLNPGPDHLITVAAVIVIVIGALRFLWVLTSADLREGRQSCGRPRYAAIAGIARVAEPRQLRLRRATCLRRGCASRSENRLLHRGE
jgi:hypothetical protein